jgi:hypothetical protein
MAELQSTFNQHESIKSVIVQIIPLKYGRSYERVWESKYNTYNNTATFK